ncbi:ATP-binding cassette sub-family C member 4-like [Chrysoperla carnea]|uniref:ATP-binding cassette sub-family C member 4-like n=1 Tax=Chrysoperla carnea TaxID=189513 RepID=UPI001D06B5DA|nr:ATP-binding cassette sub-family C member 4-like [Chrysoperla carnea]
MYSGLLVLNTFIRALGSCHILKARQLLGMQVRIACCSLIYRKLLRLKISSLSQTSNGQIINLLSNDVNRFDRFFVFVHFILVSPIQFMIISYFLWQSVQISSLIGIAVLALMTLPVQACIGNLNGSFRKKISKLTDRRVLLMNEIISGIQVIKMYAWEKPFENFVRIARIKEINVLKYSNYLKGYSSASMNYTERLPMFVTAITYALLGNVITSEKLFSMTQYFSIVQTGMSFNFANAILLTSETLITIKRIKTFLLLEEIDSIDNETNNSNSAINGEIQITNYYASWIPDQKILQNITTVIHSGEICSIIGPVGSGKSSFLNAVLSEMHTDGGKLTISGTVSYSSQDPWLFSGSIRNNILFGLSYNEDKYKDVIEVCSLTKDLLQFPYGDQTIVGDKGASLSGGQRARINLARAIYRDADIYLLDDPLSAVDVNVGKHIFHECIEKYLKGKTRILVTHQIQHLQNVNHIIALQDGEIKSEGTYDELINYNAEFKHYLNKEICLRDEKSCLSYKDQELEQDTIADTSLTSYITNQNDPKKIENEKVETGKLEFKLFLYYIKAAGNMFEIMLFLILMVGNQIFCNSTDFWMSYWSNLEDKQIFSDKTKVILLNEFGDKDLNKVEYVKQENVLTRTEVMYVYALLILFVILTSISKALYFYKLCMRASINLHNKMFHSLLKAPMRFFDKNSIGRILNRFTKDMGAADELLPSALVQGAQISTTVLGSAILISILNPYLILPTLLLIFLFLKVQSIYLATAQDIQRLEGITRSPVFSHTSSSLSGLVTIRACKAEKVLKTEFDKHQDLHTSAWYLTLLCGLSLGLCVDLICVIYITIVTSSFSIVGNSVFSGSEVGLALTKALTLLFIVQYGIRQLSEIICQMTSVERILQYTKIETEGPFETAKDILPKKWPIDGAIHFKNVFMKYDTDQPSILKNLNVEIQSGEKIGVVGRTGAGKSSLISSLFRLSIIDGDIIIDDVNIQLLGLKDLRSSIAIIPQQPVLFSATMRFNLDPFEKFEDHTLWNVLEDVKLKHCITSLDFEIQSGGTNFSIGQRQLICLARAILKQNKILVLDEATANVDQLTDALIQQTIREKFRTCTVITIAHRLNTIMDSDKVLVMDAGQMVDFDHPRKLLENKNGIFYKLYQESNSLDVQNKKNS